MVRHHLLHRIAGPSEFHSNRKSFDIPPDSLRASRCGKAECASPMPRQNHRSIVCKQTPPQVLTACPQTVYTSVETLESTTGARVVREHIEGKTALSPTLIIRLGDQKRVVSGMEAVKNVLASTNSQAGPTGAGSRFAITMAAMLALLLLLSPGVPRMGVIWPILGIIGVTFALPLCTACMTSGLTIDGLAPILSSLSFAAALLLFSMPSLGWESAFKVLLLAMICILVAQAVMLYNNPKFCLPCIIIACATGGIALTAASALDRRQSRHLILSSAPTYVLIALSMLGVSTHVNAALVAEARARTSTNRNYVGSNIKDFGIKSFSGESARRATLVLVSSKNLWRLLVSENCPSKKRHTI